MAGLKAAVILGTLTTTAGQMAPGALIAAAALMAFAVTLVVMTPTASPGLTDVADLRARAAPPTMLGLLTVLMARGVAPRAEVCGRGREARRFAENLVRGRGREEQRFLGELAFAV